MTSNGPPKLNVHAMLEARHGSTARGMDVTADTSYPRTELSELMQSPCRPEENGYFGATYGIASKLFYEFEIESRRGTELSQAIMVIEEHLMDVVLAVTFPTICSYEGDGRPPAKKTQDVVISGFRFGREELDMSRKYFAVCVKPENFLARRCCIWPVAYVHHIDTHTVIQSYRNLHTAGR